MSRFHVTGSCVECGINWVSCDPSTEKVLYPNLKCDMCGSTQNHMPLTKLKVPWELSRQLHEVWLGFEQRRKDKDEQC